MQHDQTAGLQTYKSQLGQESKMAADTKNSKTIKINFFLQNGLVYLAEIMYVVLMGPWCSEISNWRQSVSELGHNDRLKFTSTLAKLTSTLGFKSF